MRPKIAIDTRGSISFVVQSPGALADARTMRYALKRIVIGQSWDRRGGPSGGPFRVRDFRATTAMPSPGDGTERGVMLPCCRIA